MQRLFPNIPENFAISIIKPALNANSEAPSIPQAIRFDRLLGAAKEKNKPVIITVTSGPFISGTPLPSSWGTTNRVRGCTAQLTAFEAAVKNQLLDAEIYNLTRHDADYLIGLRDDKKFKYINFIADRNSALEKLLDVERINVDNVSYLQRKSIVFLPDGSKKTFEFDPEKVVDDAIAEAHVAAVAEYIDLGLVPRLTVTF